MSVESWNHQAQAIATVGSRQWLVNCESSEVKFSNELRQRSDSNSLSRTSLLRSPCICLLGNRLCLLVFRRFPGSVAGEQMGLPSIAYQLAIDLLSLHCWLDA